MNAKPLAPVLYIPHGGGPLPILGDPMHRELVAFLGQIPQQLPRPEALVVISAHWEAAEVTITGGERPALLYDYCGFPPESYAIAYPAPGNPSLANHIHELLHAAGIPARIDRGRGFDHGLFVPLTLMYPEADIPCVQVSLKAGLDAAAHIAIGKALAPLRYLPVLVLGSGFSFHNMAAFFPATEAVDPRNDPFQQWLIHTLTGAAALPDFEREQRLVSWEQAPYARYCHPREEHLLPLHVCYGIAQAAAQVVFDGVVIGKRSCALLW